MYNDLKESIEGITSRKISSCTQKDITIIHQEYFTLLQAYENAVKNLDLMEIWHHLNKLQTDWDCLLTDMQSSHDQRLPKHALDMMAKYTSKSLQEAKSKLSDQMKIIETGGLLP